MNIERLTVAEFMELITEFANDGLREMINEEIITKKDYIELQSKILQVLKNSDLTPFLSTMMLLQTACSMFEVVKQNRNMRTMNKETTTIPDTFPMVNPPLTVQ
jgi:hypothetical protein